MPNNITFRMVAWTDAAGKYDPDAPLDGNEDNYYADDDLGDDSPSHILFDEYTTLSDCGMIMAVADGMGGMNAGEVASQIAHDTVADNFAPGKITPQLAATHESRSHYMEDVIREADSRIKKDARHNHEHEGMGSTLIMAWLAGDELTVTWIGDSRAYRFNPNSGIEPLSKDHTYVQELADKGIITYEQTFEHPQGNVVTRSLGDESQKPRPESRLFKVHNSDIILLCSDGLSGVLRDRQVLDENGVPYPGENMEDIIRTHLSSLKECREALWAAAERADWYDNVTAILCEIHDGAGTYLPTAKNGHEKEEYNAVQEAKTDINKTFDGWVVKIPRKKLILSTLFLILAIAAIAGGLFWHNRMIPRNEMAADSIAVTDTTFAPIATDSTKVRNSMQKVIGTTVGSENAPAVKDEPARPKDAPKEASAIQSPSLPNETAIPADELIKAVGTQKDSLTKSSSDKNELTPVKTNQKHGTNSNR